MNKLYFHPRTAQELDQLISRPRHAVLLVGPNGSGKTTTADWLCRQLLSITSNELDPERVLWLEPDNKQLRIEQVRQAQHFAKTTANAQVLQRIIVLSQADTMAEPAQNALLKLLEEPPAGVMLLLLTNNENSLLPTVRSRCQAITILPLAKDQARQNFESVETPHFERAWRVSGGYAGMLSALLGDDASSEALDRARSYLGSTTFLKVSEHEKLKERPVAIELVDNLLILCRAALEQAATQAKDETTKIWLRRSEACLTAKEQLAKNANVKLCLDVLALNLI